MVLSFLVLSFFHSIDCHETLGPVSVRAADKEEARVWGERDRDQHSASPGVTLLPPLGPHVQGLSPTSERVSR